MRPNPKLTTIVVAALITTLFGIIGCRSTVRNRAPESPTSRAGNSPPPVMKYPPRVTVTFVPSANPKKDLDDAIKRLETAYPYRVTMSQTSGQRPTVEFVVEYAAADRYHMRDSSGGESFAFGDTTYSRFPTEPSNGEWLEGLKSVQTQEQSVQSNLPRASLNVKPAGKETVNGVECYAFKYGMPGWSECDCKAWIGAADGLLYQINEVTKNWKEHYKFEYVDVQVNSPVR